jgi:hypothetical protein
MPRARRKPGKQKLSAGQHLYLVGGAPVCGSDGFRTQAEVLSAWRLHREELVQEVGPGHRPFAFWDEIGQFPAPGESDLAALDRLGLPMSEKEKEILKSEKEKRYVR